jgi:beta-galactosidase
MDCDFSKYKLVVAPMLYMVRPNVAERLETFVKNGGTLVSTYWSGIVNETDLCFLGGFPGPLRKVLGIWSEEIDALSDDQHNSIVFNNSNELKLAGEFKSIDLCDLIHTETAETLAVYGHDFYKGRPAVTVNNFEEGKAYYIASRTNDDFNDAFYNSLIDNLELKRAINAVLPYGVTAQLRTNGESSYIFLMNFSDTEKKVEVDDCNYYDLTSKEKISKTITLSPYGLIVLKKEN